MCTDVDVHDVVTSGMEDLWGNVINWCLYLMCSVSICGGL